MLNSLQKRSSLNKLGGITLFPASKSIIKMNREHDKTEESD